MVDWGESVDGLRLAVLGPQVMTFGGEEFHLGGRVPNRLVGVLAASESQRANDREIAAAVWGDYGPSGRSGSRRCGPP